MGDVGVFICGAAFGIILCTIAAIVLILLHGTREADNYAEFLFAENNVDVNTEHLKENTDERSEE